VLEVDKTRVFRLYQVQGTCSIEGPIQRECRHQMSGRSGAKLQSRERRAGLHGNQVYVRV